MPEDVEEDLIPHHLRLWLLEEGGQFSRQAILA